MAQYQTFKGKIRCIYESHTDSGEMIAVSKFYQQDQSDILQQMKRDSLWDEIEKNLNKKYSTFSFLLDGDTKIMAEKVELMDIEEESKSEGGRICIVTVIKKNSWKRQLRQ